MTGEILQGPRRSDLARLAGDVRLSGAESIALSTLFSFANPVNEQAIGHVLEELALPLSLSHLDLARVPRVRTRQHGGGQRLPAAADAALSVAAWTRACGSADLKGASRGLRHAVQRRHHGAGIGGARAGAHRALRPGRRNRRRCRDGAAQRLRRIITFDMGGTSTDVALVRGDPKPTNEAEVAGFPVRVPMLDIHTVGAGGGSLAQFDAGGALRVGPESAGADPGPICYGRGTRPTVTDANLLLGRLQADSFLGGEFALDLSARGTHKRMAGGPRLATCTCDISRRASFAS